ncbi:MAG TPA: cyanophycin synthetase, partial [Casimicrobiaceae bacterium]|nr:cyanophycin synthetase [Casimicrobiaceae bacterium]
SDSAFFVIEGDEYDTAFFDKRSKFVHYRPRTVILNNLEFDHADIFPDLAAIETQFHHLVRTVPGVGRIVANGEEASIARVLARGLWSEVERFGPADVVPSLQTPGLLPLDWTVAGDGAIAHRGAPAGTLQIALSGRHNRMNALAALAAARHAGVPVAAGLAALASFRGVKRRMELRGSAGGVEVYDDFAHHPTAIATTLDGLRKAQPAGRILAVLEPRSNTMKLGTMKAALPGSLSQADRVYCFAANLGWDAGSALAPLGARAQVFDDLDALVRAVVADARVGDHVLVMSNGGFGGVHGKLLDALGGA